MSAPQDSIFTLLYIGGFAIMAVLAVLLFSQLAPVLNDAFTGVPQAQNVGNDFNTFFPSFFSWIFTIIFVALPLIGLGLAFITPINSFWMWIYMALSILVLAIGWMLQSLWGWFTDPIIVSDAASRITALSWVMDNYMLYSVLVVLIIGAGTYYKSNQSYSGGVGVFR